MSTFDFELPGASQKAAKDVKQNVPLKHSETATRMRCKQPVFIAVKDKKADLSARIDYKSKALLQRICNTFHQTQSTVIITALQEFAAKYGVKN